MFSYPKLNLPSFKLRVKRSGEAVSVWDRARGKWLVLTPEEWVRQHIIMWLTDYHNVPPTLIATEHPVVLNGQPQRADIVVYTSKNEPYMLIECKATEVKLDESVFAQASRYNAVIGAQYIFISNGMEHRCYAKINDHEYASVDHLPDMKSDIINKNIKL